VSSHLLPTYSRVDLAFERGEGVWLITAAGKRYLDFTSGVAVNALGHAHPHMVEAITEQAKKVWHVSNLYRIPEGERLADRLCAASFADFVFFQNSGTEAIECCIKMARKYQFAAGKPERNRIVTFEGAFHGRTLAALAATGNKKYLEGFGPAMPGFEGLGGGFPIGACLATAEAAKGMTPGTHGSTFGGNQLAMAAGNAVLDVITADGFLDDVKKKSLLLKQRLAELKDRHASVIAEVRGEGLLIGLRMIPPVSEMVDELRNEEMITVAAGDNVVRLLPPLVISEIELAEAVARIDRACARLAQTHARQAKPAAKVGAVS